MAKSVYARFGTSQITGTNTTQNQHTVTVQQSLPAIWAIHHPDQGYNSIGWRTIITANAIEDLDAIVSGNVLVVPPIPST